VGEEAASKVTLVLTAHREILGYKATPEKVFREILVPIAPSKAIPERRAILVLEPKAIPE
jgi:hypothetical protein